MLGRTNPFRQLLFFFPIVFCQVCLSATTGRGTLEGYVANIDGNDVEIYQQGAFVIVPRSSIKKRQLNVGDHIFATIKSPSDIKASYFHPQKAKGRERSEESAK